MSAHLGSARYFCATLGSLLLIAAGHALAQADGVDTYVEAEREPWREISDTRALGG